MLSNPSLTAIRLRFHWAAACDALPLICSSLGGKGLKTLLMRQNSILHILTRAAAYISHQRLPLPASSVKRGTPLASRSELCYSLHSINVQGSVSLALAQGRSVYMRR